MDPSILHGLDNHFQLLVYDPSHVLRYKPHACLRIELPHLTRRLLVARATRANIKADFFSLSAPRLGKWVTGCEKGLRVYDRAPSPLGRRQVNGHCLQGEITVWLMAATNNQQAKLKEPSHSLHYTIKRTHARLFLKRGPPFPPSFPQSERPGVRQIHSPPSLL